MPEFLKNFFEKKGKKGVQSLVLMLVVGVILLVASAYLASTGGGINIMPLASESLPMQSFDIAHAEEASPLAEAATFSSYLTQQLEEILSLVAGAGNVRVMLTVGNSTNVFAQNSQENVAATTEDDGEGGVRSIHSVNSSITYVMVRRSDGSEAPLMLQEISPDIEGIIIVAQGAGDIAVVDALTRAAQAVLGVAPHRIQVLEMR
ncbi:MAG: hypothetical protein FWC76_01465 [Defluviitaleaceae bacterium]|nr:hypothetical protein [Defluviitaleaceae bacterium]